MSNPVLSDDIIKALTSYTVNMEVPVTFVLQTGEYAKREELVEFLSAIASVSDKLLLDEIRNNNAEIILPIDGYGNIKPDNKPEKIKAKRKGKRPIPL